MGGVEQQREERGIRPIGKWGKVAGRERGVKEEGEMNEWRERGERRERKRWRG